MTVHDRIPPIGLHIYFKEDIKMKRILEIQAAEGGEDSRLFADDLANAYTRLGNALG